MSLEQAIQENTAALNRLVEMFAGVQFQPQTAEVNVEQPHILHTETIDIVAEKPQPKATATPIQVEESPVTFDDVKAALMQVAKKSRSELQQILSHFGATNLSAIQEKDFAEVVQMADQVLETADV
jgi:hypothetical protein